MTLRSSNVWGALRCFDPNNLMWCSEGDRLSGLVVDAFGDTLVVASSAAWVELCVRLAPMHADTLLLFYHLWAQDDLHTLLTLTGNSSLQASCRAAAAACGQCSVWLCAQIEGSDHRSAAGGDAWAAGALAAVSCDACGGGHGVRRSGGGHSDGARGVRTSPSLAVCDLLHGRQLFVAKHASSRSDP